MNDDYAGAGQNPRTPDPANHDQQSEPDTPAPTDPDAASGPDPKEDAASPIESSTPPSQVDVLIDIANGKCELFRDDTDTPYARLDSGIAVAIEGKLFSRWLQFEYRRFAGRTSLPTNLKRAVDEIAATARFDGPTRRVHLRVAETEDGIALHLGGDDATAALVSASGTTLGRAPVDFEKRRQMDVLPRPALPGALQTLAPLLNFGSDANLKLIIAWLLMAIKPTGPKPILILQGPPGSAKSTVSEVLKYLIDPGTPLLRTLPRSERDLAVAGSSHWILAFDNASWVSEEMSNALCRLSTGAGFGARTLYSDAEETVFEHMRPVILNGLDALATRQDLLDRAIVIRLPEISRHAGTRVPKDILWARVEQLRPLILGGLLEAAQAATANQGKVKIDKLPRMADFTLWVAGAEEKLGWPSGSFLAAFEENQGDALKASLEGSLLAEAILKTLDPNAKEIVELEGQPADVLGLLTARTHLDASNRKSWPKNAQAMSKQLTLLAPALSEFGVVVENSHVGRGQEKRRWLSIKRVDAVEVTSEENGS